MIKTETLRDGSILVEEIRGNILIQRWDHSNSDLANPEKYLPGTTPYPVRHVNVRVNKDVRDATQYIDELLKVYANVCDEPGLSRTTKPIDKFLQETKGRGVLSISCVA